MTGEFETGSRELIHHYSEDFIYSHELHESWVVGQIR
jgi:hypothetical protein